MANLHESYSRRVIQTAMPFIEASGLKLKLEEGIAETHFSRSCIKSARDRFAYFPFIDTQHETIHMVENTPGAEWVHKKTGQRSPCEAT